MKIITIFFLAVSFCCCPNDVSTKEIAEKARRLRIELMNSKSLPANFLKSSEGSGSSPDKVFMYYTTRKENNSVDSILMIVSIYLKDSSEHIISFNEVHLKDNKTFMYQLNKQGVIDWAYKADNPESLNIHDIEINTDSSNSLSSFTKPDEKTIAFYNSKLKTSLDELEKILFVK